MEAFRQTVVATAYGPGKVVSYRADDDIYQVSLPFGMLCATTESLVQSGNNPGIAMNAACRGLEKKRKQHLEHKCAALGMDCNHEMCTSCLLFGTSSTTTTTATPTSENQPRMPNWVSKLRESQKTLLNVAQKTRTRTTTTTPALPPACRVCANPTCRQHQSVDFYKQKIVLCHSCETLFRVNFNKLVPKQHEQDEEQQALQLVQDKIAQMVQTYDRIVVLLSHATPFIPDLVQRLQATEMRNNRVGVGTAGAGILSGALGLAGTAAIFTPAGVPLLLASLALSGSSVAVTASNSAINLFYENNPQAVADQIIVMYSMISCVVEAANSLRSVALAKSQDKAAATQQLKKEKGAHKSHGRDNDDQGDDEADVKEADNEYTSQRSVDTIQVEKVVNSLRLLRQTGTGIDLANTAATSSTAVRSSGGAAASGLLNSGANILKVVPVLGAAFSGFCLAMDADRLKQTLDRIKAGDPSEKADALLRIYQAGLQVVPPTQEFQSECTYYFDMIEKTAYNQMPQ